MLATIVVALIGSGGFGAGVTYLATRRKTKAETDNLSVKTAESVVGMLREQVESLNRRVTDVEERLTREQRETARLRRWVSLLIEQIRGLGVEPVPEPTE